MAMIVQIVDKKPVQDAVLEITHIAIGMGQQGEHPCLGIMTRIAETQDDPNITGWSFLMTPEEARNAFFNIGSALGYQMDVYIVDGPPDQMH